MKRLSIAAPTSRRKSGMPVEDQKARQILEQLDQDTTMVLQDIDRNLSRTIAAVNGKLRTAIQGYINESTRVKQSTGFWKKFFESSANVVLDSYEAPIAEVSANANLLNALNDDDNNNNGVDIDVAGGTDNGNVLRTTASGLPESRSNSHLRAIVEEDTSTWSTEQAHPNKPNSSTPQRANRFTSQQRAKLAGDAFGARLTDNVNLQHPTSVSLSQQQQQQQQQNGANISPAKDQQLKQSPIRIQTIRQSLDAYHRVSISPRKQRTSTFGRSAVIQNILNSSPTFPEPPVLKSDLASEQSRLVNTTSPHPSSDIEPHLRKFPHTPKYSGISSGGSSHHTPLAVQDAVQDESDNELQPPRLETSSQDNELDLSNSDSSEKLLPRLNTIELTSSAKRRQESEFNSSNKRSRPLDKDEENVFLEKESKDSRQSPIDDDKHKSRNEVKESGVATAVGGSGSGQSKSITQVFNEGISRATRDENVNAEVETNELIQENVTTDVTREGARDLTEGSTAELGPFKERWKYFSSL
ncbi:ASK1 [Candida oxycetoniae]|uniref:DASH complex subunit ASK1 n=1 Tax=Candida oxycetoniae TaxID=497107 RepID=A0AAI9SUZ4_9ASCO|nr:ASK1 [Candida oxycetoniae]KAI3403193.2 ASK1 [Candida oxycetoniae]